jgi:trimeric autotransporter adhesin
MRFDVSANDKASATFAKIAAAAERLEEKLKDLNKRFTPTVKLAGVAETRREVASLRRDFDKIRDIRAKVRVSVTGGAQVNNLSEKLERLNDAHVAVHVSIQPPGVEARLRALNGLLRSLQGRTEHTVEIKEKGATATQSRLGSLRGLLNGLTGTKGLAAFTGSLIAVGGAATAATAAVGGLVAAAATLGGAFVATGPILLASAGMIGGVLATIKVGTQGLSQAFEALAEGDMKKWGKALANLSPEAQKFAVAIKDVWGALRQAQGAVQDNLFQGMGEAVAKLARVELPVLKQGMGAVATELNTAAKSVMEYVGSSEGIARQQSMWASTATVVRNLRPGLTNITAAMFDIGEVGGRVLADITGGTGEAGAGFRKMIADARASGELEQIMRRGVDVLRQLGSIAGNVGSILGSIFKAAQTAGADFLTTLERGTAALADFLSAGAGQTALVDFFRESRATLDALGAGLVAAAGAAAAFVSAFSNTGGLSAVGTALSALMTAVAPLAETLGRLAGETLRLLAESAINLAAALTPIVTVISGVVSAMGPLAPMILASVLAFKGLTAVSAGIAALGAAASGAALKMGVYTTAVTGSIAAGTRAATAATILGTALRGLSLAIPIIGVALVAATALFGAFGAAAKAGAEEVANGSATFQQSVQAELAALRERKAAIAAANIEGAEFGSVHDAMAASVDGGTAALTAEQQAVANAEAKWTEYRNTLSPMEQLKADVARAQGELNDIMAAGGAGTTAAAEAAARLAEAQRRLAAAEGEAAAAVAATNQTLSERIGAVQSALGATLQMEEALSRVGEAEKRANEAAKQHGASSKEAADANRDFAGAADQAAQAAQKHAEQLTKSQGATNSADVGARTYAATLAQIAATSSGPAQQGLLSYVDSLSDTELATLNAQTAALGFKTELLALPSGRNVVIAVDPETGEIISTQQLLDTIQDKTVTINGNAMPAQQALTTVLSEVAAGAESVTINGQAMPAQQALATVLGMITGSSGTVTINGQAVPAQTVLSALIASVNAGSGTVNINGQDVPAQAVLQALIGSINSGTGTVTLDANGQPVQTAKTEAEQPTSSEHTLGAPVTDNTTAPKTAAEAPTGNPHTVGAPVTDNTTAPKTSAATPTANPHTLGSPVTDNVAPAKTTAQQPTESMHTLNCDDKAVVDAKSRAEQATSSMHTINCDDSAVRNAKAAAQRNTSSTHTIHVVVVGAAPPRAAGAYTTPRAEGAYAAPMAQGGMRRMSSARAEIVPPRQPRIIGDRMQGDEAFIPINDSSRSKSILNTAANRMGYDLVPHGGAAPDAMLSSMRAAVSQRTATRTSGDGGRVVAAIEALRRDLAATPRQISNEITVNGAGGTETAAAVAQKQRTLAALGIFG